MQMQLKIKHYTNHTFMFQLDVQVSQNWRTNYLLPYRGCLNVHKKIWEKFFRQKNQLFLLLLTLMQCKQRYIRTSLPCDVTVVHLK
jgi:hypothetical protein